MVTNEVVKEIQTVVEAQVTSMIANGEMRQTTGEYIVGGGDKAGVYYEIVKTHKMDENQNMSEGFPTRGIMSIKNTAIERLGDFVDFKVNKGMQLLPTYLMIPMKAAARQNWPT